MRSSQTARPFVLQVRNFPDAPRLPITAVMRIKRGRQLPLKEDPRAQMGTTRNAPEKIRVLIADDSEEMLNDIEALLASDFDIVGKATDGVSAVEAASRLKPDVIVTDLTMPGLSGIEASRKMLTACPNVPIVLLTLHNDARLVEQALSVGIRGYVHKLTAVEELIPALYYALRGKTFVSPACRRSQPN